MFIKAPLRRASAQSIVAQADQCQAGDHGDGEDEERRRPER